MRGNRRRRAPGAERGVQLAGRTEIVDAVRAIVAAGIPADQVDEETVASYLYTAAFRTRIS